MLFLLLSGVICLCIHDDVLSPDCHRRTHWCCYCNLCSGDLENAVCLQYYTCSILLCKLQLMLLVTFLKNSIFLHGYKRLYFK